MKYLWILAVLTVVLSPLEAKVCPAVSIREIRLENGMVVVLKKTKFEPGEVLVKLTACGGYGSLPEEQLPSGRFAHKISWESGLGKLSADQLSALMYNRSIDLSTKVLPYSRTIEGNSGAKGLRTLLKLINLQFTQQSFTRDGYNALMSSVKEKIEHRDDYQYNTFDDLHKQFNSCGHYPHVNKNSTSLKRVDFETAKKFAYDSFSNPAEFKCVIVGDFNEKKLMKYINKHLASIPPSNNPSHFSKFSPLSFPKGNQSSMVKLYHRKDSITRLTFPVHIDLGEEKIHLLEATCKTIENRVSHSISSRLQGRVRVNVSFEMPYFPCSHSCWINIQIVGPCNISAQATQVTVQEVNRLIRTGPTDKEMVEVKKFYETNDPYWLTENEYWLTTLTNYYLSDWNPDSLAPSSYIEGLSNQDVSVFLKQLISTDNYTQMTATP